MNGGGAAQAEHSAAANRGRQPHPPRSRAPGGGREPVRGLGSEWFWEDEFRIPEPTCWSKENAAWVAWSRAEGRTHEPLAAQFGVTVSIIRKALQFAVKASPRLAQLPRKMLRARCEDSHAEELWALWQEGRSTEQRDAHFGRSEPLIRVALNLAASRTSSTGQPVGLPPEQSGPEVEQRTSNNLFAWCAARLTAGRTPHSFLSISDARICVAIRCATDLRCQF